MRNLILPRNSKTQLVIACYNAILSYFILLLFIAALPGISVGQCPTSFTGHMQSDDTNSTYCGYRQIDAAIAFDPTNTTFNATLGGMDITFSSNVKIYLVNVSFIQHITQTHDDNHVYLNFGEPGCQYAQITHNATLVRIIYTLLSGSSATAVTSNLRLGYDPGGCTFGGCGYGSNASATNISENAYELHGKLLAPGQFSCSGGSSTDHGLPNREVTISMADSPYWPICENITTDAYGYYECDDLRSGCDYKICVTNDDAICGLDEFDHDLIGEFLLGEFTCWDYLWQAFAADVNNNGYITSNDEYQISAYLLNASYNIPLPWKYISATQYNDVWDEYICGGSPIPIVTNCSELTMPGSTTNEDWYGFPAGDVNHNCTTCGFRGGQDYYTRSENNSKMLYLSKTDNDTITISFYHEAPVSTWSLELKLDFPVEAVKNIFLENCNSEEFNWNIDKSNNTIKMIFGELKGLNLFAFNIKIQINKSISVDLNSWEIYRNDPRIHNILIDKNKYYFYWENIKIKSNKIQFLYPNPSNNFLHFSEFDPITNEVSLYQSDGKLIQIKNLKTNSLDISSLLPGIYFIRYKDERFDQKFRFIKCK